MIHKKNHIYKYAPVNAFTFKNLLLGTLWFGPPDSMNDILEGRVRIKNPNFQPSNNALMHFISKNRLEEFIWGSQVWESSDFMKDFLNHWYDIQRNQYGISCFSEKYDEKLMWSHYADKHQGICLIYDRDLLLESLKTHVPECQWFTVNYKKRPLMELVEENDEVKFKSIDPVLNYKESNWAYEKEVRFMGNFENDISFKGKSFTIYKSALKGVIYGANMDNDDTDSIALILRNDPLYENVTEYNSFIDYEKGTLHILDD